MTAKRLRKIYVSSTTKDLQDYRKAAIQAIRDLGHFPVVMEHYGAVDQSAVEKCLSDVRQCDAYIGIIAWRYGFVPDGFEHSITELEYLEAEKQNVSRFLFLLDDNAPWAPGAIDRQRDLIDGFRQRLMKSRIVAFFDSPTTLAKLVTSALVREDFTSGENTSAARVPQQKADERKNFLHTMMRLATHCRNSLRGTLKAPTEQAIAHYRENVSNYAEFLYDWQLLTSSSELYELLHLFKRQAERVDLFMRSLTSDQAELGGKGLSDCEKAYEDLDAFFSRLRDELREELKRIDLQSE